MSSPSLPSALLPFSQKLSRLLVGYLLLLGGLAGHPLQAQKNDTATVAGIITDAGGAAIPGATLSLREINLGSVVRVKANSEGKYQFANVQIGNYTVTAEAPGFTTTVTTPFELTLGSRQQMDISLKVGGANESITVSVNSGGLQKESGEQSTTIESEQIIDLPLNGREYSDLAVLAPGVQIGSLQDQSATQRRSSLVVNGNRSTANTFLLDGLDNNSYQGANQGLNNQVVSLSAEAVQRASFITSNFAAEYGRVGGAVISVTSKSGSPMLHGSVFEYLRNTDINAYGPFKSTGVKPELIQNQFGFSLGYRIPKIKDLFFFVDYEGVRQVSGGLVTITLPTMDQRNGIFMAPTSATNPALIPVPLQNPITGKQYVNGVIPKPDFTPFAAAVLDSLPAPTQNIAPGSGSNYFQTERTTNFRDLGDIRLDKQIGNRLQTFARFSRQSNHIAQPPGIIGPAGGGTEYFIFTTSGVAAATYALTSTSVLDFRVGVNYNNTGKYPVRNSGTSFYSQFNVPYPISPSLTQATLNTQSVGYFTAFGAPTNDNQFDSPRTVNTKASYTLAAGRHNLSFGLEWLHIGITLDPGSPLLGSDTYNGQYSYNSHVAQPGSTTARKQADDLADFIFGARDTYSLANYTLPQSYYDYYFAYAEDTWRASSRLTVNYGLRYEFVLPERSHDQQLANFNPQTNQLILSTKGSIFNEALTNPKLDDFAPRFGFAYSLYPNIVFRGGYGLSYIQFDRGDNSDELLANGPATVITSIGPQVPPMYSRAATGTVLLPLCADGSNIAVNCFRTTMQGYPTSMISPASFSTADTNTHSVPIHNSPGYVQSYSFGTQVQLNLATVLNVAYVGSHGVHIHVQGDYNEAAPQLPGQALSLLQRRPVPNFQTIYAIFGGGFLRYNSLQANLTHRFAGGLFLSNSFTWAKGFDNASGLTEPSHGDSQAISLRNPSYYNGLSGYDQRLNDTAGLVWKIPFGEKVRSHALRQVTSGWSLTSVTRLTTGLPWNIYYAADDPDETSPALVYRPNLTGSVRTLLNPRSKWIINNGPSPVTFTVNGATQSCTGYCNVINSSQLSLPVTAANGGSSPYGSLPRNSFTGPGYVNVDFGIHKNFVLPRRMNLQFRAESFNVMNHINFKAPNLELGSASFGEFTGGSGSAYPPRQFQFALRLTY